MQYADVMAPVEPNEQTTRRYEQDLWELRDLDRARRIDRARAHNIALALNMIHSEPRHPSSYGRGVTEALTGTGGISRFAAWVGEDHPILRPDRLEKMEVGLVHWRWLLREKRHRARRIHGSLRPEHIFFRNEECMLLDPPTLSGEPAQDIAAVTMRYVTGALGRRGKFAGALREVWDEFWSGYLEGSGDLEILEVIPPFYAREALERIAMNAPEPMPEPAQRIIAEFAEVMLAGRPFRPDHLDGILP